MVVNRHLLCLYLYILLFLFLRIACACVYIWTCIFYYLKKNDVHGFNGGFKYRIEVN